MIEEGLSRTKVSRDLGLDITALRRWIKEFAAAGERAFPGHGHPRNEELTPLRRENELPRQERDILKKKPSAFSRGCRNEPKIGNRAEDGVGLPAAVHHTQAGAERHLRVHRSMV